MALTLDFGPQFYDRFGVTFDKGDVIFCEFEPGNTFFFLIEGRIKVVKISGDKEKTLDVLEAGELFGEMAILEEAPRSATMIAETKVKALEFNKENFQALLSSKPELAIKLLKVFAKRIYDQKRRLMILTLPSNEAKIADVFLMLAEHRNINISEVKDISFNIHPDDVSSWSGVERNMCKQILAQFAKQNRIVIKSDSIIVTNINDFYRLVLSKRKE